LGVLYMSINKRKEAETSFRKAIRIEEEVGTQDGLLAPILGNLAGLYVEQKRWSRAEPLLRSALSIAEASFGHTHPETAIILSTLGLASHGQGKLKDAKEAYHRALEIRRKVFGPGDIAVAVPLFSLARALAAEGNYLEAKSRFAESLKIQEDKL